MASIPRRPCSKCGKNRAEKFFTSPRGRVCTDCQRQARRTSGHGLRTEQKYDITRSEWMALFRYQGGLCAICLGKRGYRLDVDHDHRKAERLGVRASVYGLLCKRCNRVLLPAAWRDPKILRAAADYLENPPAPRVLGRQRRQLHRSSR